VRDDHEELSPKTPFPYLEEGLSVLGLQKRVRQQRSDEQGEH